MLLFLFIHLLLIIRLIYLFIFGSYFDSGCLETFAVLLFCLFSFT